MSLRSYSPLLLVAGLLAGWLGAAGAQEITITGYNRFTFRMDSIRGSATGLQAYNYGNYERTRQFENNAGLSITGRILSRVSLTANIQSSRYSPDRSQYHLDYDGNGLDITVGDINAAIAGNEFMPFHKSLLGMKVDAMVGRVKLSTLLSEERAQVALDKFYGTNSPGPYSLRYSPIIDGTEQVRVDGQPKKLGQDYTIDYNTGMIWFQQTMLIPQTSLIEVSYEYAGYGSSPGILVGSRAEMPLLDRGLIGLTYIAQASRARAGNSPDANFRTDQFIGDNTPMVLSLRYRPVRKVIRITVDGLDQKEGVDFEVVSLDAGLLRFRKVVPAPPGVLTDAAPNVIVEYEVVPTTSPSAVGDRGIFGLDGQYRFGKNTNLTMHFAHSGGASDRTGNALSIRGTTTLGSLTLGLNFRDVGRNFSAIESVGFQQKERALEGSLEYTPVDHLRFTGRFSSSLRPSSAGYYGHYGSSTGGSTETPDEETDTEGDIRALQSSFGVSMNYPKWPTVDLTHQRYHTSGPQINSGSAMTGLRLQYALGSTLNFSANFDHSANEDTGRYGSEAASLTQRYSVSYIPGTRFSIQADYSNSSISSRYPVTNSTDGTDDDTGTIEFTDNRNRATGASITMNYSPIRMATLTATYRVSDSGSGYSGTGYPGYGGSYFTNPYAIGGYLNSGNYSFGDQYTGSYSSPYGSYGSGGYYGYGSSIPDGGTPPGADTSLFGNLRSLPWLGWRALSRQETTDPDPTEESQSYRIRSIDRSIGLQLNPIDRLSLSLNYSTRFQEGQLAGSDSHSVDTTLGLTYMPWERFSFNAQFMKQRNRFVGSGGGNSDSSMAALGAQFGPFSKLTFRLNYHVMGTDTSLGAFGGYIPPGSDPTGSDPGTGEDTLPTTTAYNTQFNTLSFGVDYPIGQGRKVFTEFQMLRTKGGGTFSLEGGPEDSTRLTSRLGLEFSLKPLLGQKLNWNLRVDVSRVSHKDRNNPNRNYSGNQLTGQIDANF